MLARCHRSAKLVTLVAQGFERQVGAGGVEHPVAADTAQVEPARQRINRGGQADGVFGGQVDEPGLYTRRKKIYYKLLHGADVAIDNPDWTIIYSQMDEA